MNLKEQFPSGISSWVAHDVCEYRQEKGRSVIRPGPDSQTVLYNPLEPEMTQLLLVEAINAGREIKQGTVDDKQAIRDFVESFGFLGIYADLPLNDDFMDQASNVFIPDNPFGIPAGVMQPADYLSLFSSAGYIPDNEDVFGKASRRGELYNFIFSASYGEDMEWFKSYFLRLYECFLACANSDRERRAAVLASEFHLKRLSYTVTAGSKPKLQWIFPSLKSVIDMAMALCVTAEDMPLRVCKKCGKVFYNENARSEFCSGRCRNQWNVYRSRGRR